MKRATIESSDKLVDVYALNDMDRFTLDTEKAFHLLLDVAEEAGVSRSMIEDEYQRHKDAKKSFNVAGYVEQLLRSEADSQRTWETSVLPFLIERGYRQDLLMPGVEEYIAALDEHSIPHGLYTYGSWSNEVADPGLDRERSVKWQLGKAAASSVLSRMPIAISNTPHKIDDLMHNAVVTIDGVGDVVRLPDELSLSPGGTTYAKHIIMGEDKLVALEGGNPDLVTGVLVVPDGANRNAHHQGVSEGSLPSYVKQYRTLSEAAHSLGRIVEQAVNDR